MWRLSVLALALMALLAECNERPNMGFQEFNKNNHNGRGFQSPDGIPGYKPKRKKKPLGKLDKKYVNKVKNQHARMKREARSREL
jgi:hypothetical protein